MLLLGLDVDFSWHEALLLIRDIWVAFGISRDTNSKTWKAYKLREHINDERLRPLIHRFGAGSKL